MAIKITEECINCGACEPECPNNAIYEGGVEWAIADGTTMKGPFTLMDGTVSMQNSAMRRLAVDIYYITYLINVPNARDFMKNPSVLPFVRSIAVCLMKCTAKRLKNCWRKRQKLHI